MLVPVEVPDLELLEGRVGIGESGRPLLSVGCCIYPVELALLLRSGFVLVFVVRMLLAVIPYV